MFTIFNFGNGVFAMNEIQNEIIKVLINEQEISFETPLPIINNRVLVPAWQLYKALGATAEWRENTEIAIATIDETKIAVRIENDSILVNGQFVKVDVAPRLIDDILFVPIRAICENFGGEVEWDELTKTVKITIESKIKSDSTPSVIAKKDINEIWKIENKEEFVIEMDSYIAEKCENGDYIEILNEDQRVFYITQSLEMEVNNGGFSQYFFNSYGNFGNELVASFEKIGAMKTAEICKKAISIFPNKVPTDWGTRQEFLTPDDEKEEERIEELFNECDDAFYEYEDDLVELNYQFIINHKESFLK